MIAGMPLSQTAHKCHCDQLVPPLTFALATIIQTPEKEDAVLDTTAEEILEFEPQTRSLPKFGRLPRDIRNDPALPAESLVVLAFRSMFAGKFKLHPNFVRQFIAAKPCFRKRRVEKPCVHRPGMGVKAFYSAMKTCKDLGYIRHTRTGKATNEDLTFQPPYDSPQIQFAWFEAGLSLNALATLIWLEVNQNAYRREVSERFGWSDQKAQWALRELIEKGFVKAMPQVRNQKGCFGAQQYCTNRYAEYRDSNSPIDEKDLHDFEQQDRNPVHGFTASDLPERGFGLDILKDSLELRDSWDEKPIQQDSKHPAFADAKAANVDRFQNELIDKKDEMQWRIWAWLDHEEKSCHWDCYGEIGYGNLAEQVQDADVERITNIMPLEDILRLARGHSAGRIEKVINNLELAKCIAFIAAGILVHENNDVHDPTRALQLVLSKIRSHVGLEKKNWINNLAMIGKPVFLKNHKDEFAAGCISLNEPALQIRRVAVHLDSCGVMSGCFSSEEDRAAVERLISEFGIQTTAAAINAWLERLASDCGHRAILHDLTSWKHLRQDCIDQRCYV